MQLELPAPEVLITEGAEPERLPARGELVRGAGENRGVERGRPRLGMPIRPPLENGRDLGAGRRRDPEQSRRQQEREAGACPQCHTGWPGVSEHHYLLLRW